VNMLPPHAAGARRLVLALVAALIGTLVAWHAAHFSPRTAALILAIALLPWVWPLRGLVHGNRRTYAASTLLVLPYLAYGVTEVLANPGARAYAGTTVFLSFALFVALVAFLRVSRIPPRAPS
jgi:uncharacterized membrane protein